ncbi:polyisoprenoid diphosphate/phosphate phosphohydrolase PLPP6-like [Diadema setosum]|uniref:polyisoprenoid diphosphate/phosphate phosphohydrolase PLPP6-like n=1 Tax=Diadema setosum TaxID=31175 RepID=UPI003B3B4CC5
MVTQTSMWKYAVQLDKEYTLRCSVCASCNSSYGWLRPIMKFLEISGHGLPWFGFCLPLLFRSYQVRDMDAFNPTANLIIGLLLDLLVSFVIKALVRRPRPAANEDDMLMTVAVDNYSFPSGHCTRVAFLFYFFMTSYVIPGYLQLLLLTWTMAVSVSRVLLGRHYWSDVVCGSIIGLIQGIVMNWYWKTWTLSDTL